MGVDGAIVADKNWSSKHAAPGERLSDGGLHVLREQRLECAILWRIEYAIIGRLECAIIGRLECAIAGGRSMCASKHREHMGL
jgi:hypothetical protein